MVPHGGGLPAVRAAALAANGGHCLGACAASPQLSPDSEDRINTNTFYAYVRSKVILLQTRIQLA